MKNTRIPDLHYHLTIGVTLEQFFKQPINRAIDAEDTAVAYGTIKQLDGIPHSLAVHAYETRPWNQHTHARLERFTIEFVQSIPDQPTELSVKELEILLLSKGNVELFADIQKRLGVEATRWSKAWANHYSRSITNATVVYFISQTNVIPRVDYEWARGHLNREVIKKVCETALQQVFFGDGRLADFTSFGLKDVKLNLKEGTVVVEL